MDEQIICIDGKFTSDQLAFWRQHNVSWPEQDKFYTVRELIPRNSEGNSALLLNEIKNPKVPIKHPILGVTQIEPNWNIRRFAHLNGAPLTVEEVKEMDRQHNLLKNLNF